MYLGVGLVLGPTLLHLFHFNPLEESALLGVSSARPTGDIALVLLAAPSQRREKA